MISEIKLREIYAMMHRIRKFEEKAIEFNARGIIGGSIHLCIGQEAVPATIGAMLGKEDYICSTHRGHGHVIGKGARTDRALAELLGKAAGFCGGRGGSMHIADFENGILGANGIVGGGIPCAVGAALSLRMQNKANVSIAFLGDAATNQGVFHESVNLAAVWKLPVIFVCENNGYGISVPFKKSTTVADIARRAEAYNIPGYIADGNDVFSIHEFMLKAINRARSGEGPSIVECKTYRWRGHWEGDPQVSRNDEDLKKWMSMCPIERLKKHLVEVLHIDLRELDSIEADIIKEIEMAAEFALQSPYPETDNLMDGLFTNGSEVSVT